MSKSSVESEQLLREILIAEGMLTDENLNLLTTYVRDICLQYRINLGLWLEHTKDIGFDLTRDILKYALINRKEELERRSESCQVYSIK